LGSKRLELVPLSVELRRIFGVALDEIADTHHELGLQEIELADRVLENARSMPPCTISDDRELELIGRVVEIEVRPWVGLGYRGIRDRWGGPGGRRGRGGHGGRRPGIGSRWRLPPPATTENHDCNSTAR